MANTMFRSDNEFIRLVHMGEASCLGLYNKLNAEKEAIVIDERTTRMLCESPENLRELLETKLHRRITSKKENYDYFRKFQIIRTSELTLMAYKLGIIKLPGTKQEVVEAILYAAKFKGCSISDKEIDIAKKLL
jgi:hypothetical protein